MIEPFWLTLARGQIGQKETPSPATDNPAIKAYWKDAGLESIGGDHPDDVPWCAAFVGAMLERAGAEGSGKANARSYATFGKGLLGPVFGCICVLSRPGSSWQGHVGFLLGTDMTRVQLLGGNQGDAVTIANFERSRLIAYRWPAGLIEPQWVGPRISQPAPSNVSDR